MKLVGQLVEMRSRGNDYIMIIYYSSIRNDWYSSNQYIPRLMRAHLKGKKQYSFNDFPSYWIPVFEYFRITWEGFIKPPIHTPFFSDLSEKQLLNLISKSKKAGTLRILVESTSHLDPILSDFLYIADHTFENIEIENALNKISSKAEKSNQINYLNGWQSYGRPSIRILESKMLDFKKKSSSLLILPCSKKRPYDKSKTHKQIHKILEESGYSDLENVDKIVISSIGVIPSHLWSNNEVLNYNAGVPDIYRILRLMRLFFPTISMNKY